MKIRITNKDNSRVGLDFLCVVGFLGLMFVVTFLAWAAGRIVHNQQLEHVHSETVAQALPMELPRSYSDE